MRRLRAWRLRAGACWCPASRLIDINPEGYHMPLQAGSWVRRWRAWRPRPGACWCWASCRAQGMRRPRCASRARSGGPSPPTCSQARWHQVSGFTIRSLPPCHYVIARGRLVAADVLSGALGPGCRVLRSGHSLHDPWSVIARALGWPVAADVLSGALGPGFRVLRLAPSLHDPWSVIARALGWPVAADVLSGALGPGFRVYDQVPPSMTPGRSLRARSGGPSPPTCSQARWD